jgi:hypothetical protein
MQWWQWMLFNPSATRLVRQVDAQLGEAFIRFVTLSSERKTLVSSYTVQFITRMIPEYDFRHGFYAQFVAFAIDKPTEVLKQGVATFADIRNGAQEGREWIWFIPAHQCRPAEQEVRPGLTGKRRRDRAQSTARDRNRLLPRRLDFVSQRRHRSRLRGAL